VNIGTVQTLMLSSCVIQHRKPLVINLCEDRSSRVETTAGTSGLTTSFPQKESFE
jgi:hypothetical protein